MKSRERIKELNAIFEERQGRIKKENAKVFSAAAQVVGKYNLNPVSYREVMIDVMDHIIAQQRKKVSPERMFGGDMNRFIHEACKGKATKSTAETILEAVGIMGIIFAIGFCMMLVLGVFSKEQPLSLLEITRWGILFILSIGMMLFFRTRQIKNQFWFMIALVFSYSAVSTGMEMLFEGNTSVAITINTYVAIPVSLICGLGCFVLRSIIADRRYVAAKEAEDIMRHKK